MLNTGTGDINMTKFNKDDYLANEREETINDIRSAREKLGKFTMRDFHEGVYGSAYTEMVLGDDGGKDVLMEDLSAADEIRAEAGRKQSNTGGNMVPKTNFGNIDKKSALDALTEQEGIAEEAAMQSYVDGMKENGPRYTNSPSTEDVMKSIPSNELLEAIGNMSEEEQQGLLALAKSLGKGLK